MKPGGKLLFNCPWVNLNDIESQLPPLLKNEIAKKEVELFVIDAQKIARDLGLGSHINNIMLACFYKLTEVLPFTQSL